MFDALKSLLADLGGRADRHPAVLDERLATAALLVHTIAVDGGTAPAEGAALRAALARTYGLSTAETDALIADARAWDSEAVDLYGFTSVLKQRLGAEERARTIEMMWEIVYADGGVHEFEDNLVWRVAELLGVSARDRIHLRQRIEARSRGA